MITIDKVWFVILVIGASITYGILAIFGFYMIWYAIDELTSENLKKENKNERRRGGRGNGDYS